jgi:hypothetical protein
MPQISQKLRFLDDENLRLPAQSAENHEQRSVVIALPGTARVWASENLCKKT